MVFIPGGFCRFAEAVEPFRIGYFGDQSAKPLDQLARSRLRGLTRLDWVSLQDRNRIQLAAATGIAPNLPPEALAKWREMNALEQMDALLQRQTLTASPRSTPTALTIDRDFFAPYQKDAKL